MSEPHTHSTVAGLTPNTNSKDLKSAEVDLEAAPDLSGVWPPSASHELDFSYPAAAIPFWF